MYVNARRTWKRVDEWIVLLFESLSARSSNKLHLGFSVPRYSLVLVTQVNHIKWWFRAFWNSLAWRGSWKETSTLPYYLTFSLERLRREYRKMWYWFEKYSKRASYVGVSWVDIFQKAIQKDTDNKYCEWNRHENDLNEARIRSTKGILYLSLQDDKKSLGRRTTASVFLQQLACLACSDHEIFVLHILFEPRHVGDGSQDTSNIEALDKFLEVGKKNIFL